MATGRAKITFGNSCRIMSNFIREKINQSIALFILIVEEIMLDITIEYIFAMDHGFNSKTKYIKEISVTDDSYVPYLLVF